MNELINKIEWGGIYYPKEDVETYCERSDFSHEQRYHWWVPVYNEENDTVYMVNTYQLDSYGGYGEDFLDKAYERLVSYKKHGKYAYYGTHNYYYHSAIKLNEDKLNKFALAFKLNEVKITSCPEEYDESDVIKHVRLYWEHAYPNGISVVRKNANKNCWNQIEKLCRKFMDSADEPHIYSYDLDEIIKAKKKAEADGSHFNKKRVDAIIEYAKIIQELENSFKEKYANIKDNLNNFHDFDEESYLESKGLKEPIAFKEVHPDVSRFLREDCYCPNEIYDLSGFGYWLIPEDSKVIELGKKELEDKTVVFLLYKEIRCSQILILETNNEKILDATRIDATENNFNKVQDIICNKAEFDYKFDRYVH